MRNGEVIGTIEPGSGQRVIARAVAMQPGETYAQAVARQDARSARIQERMRSHYSRTASERIADAAARGLI